MVDGERRYQAEQGARIVAAERARVRTSIATDEIFVPFHAARQAGKRWLDPQVESHVPFGRHRDHPHCKNRIAEPLLLVDEDLLPPKSLPGPAWHFAYEDAQIGVALLFAHCPPALAPLPVPL